MKLLYMEVLSVSKILIELKSVRKTAKVGGFDRFFLTGPKNFRRTAKVSSFVAMSTKLQWLEVLTALKL